MPRTNRLVDRICQVYSNDESIWNIPINRFWGACVDLLGGYHTTAQITTFFDLNSQESAELSQLIGVVTAKSNTINTNLRDRAIQRIRTILVYYEDGGIPGYQTPDEVWQKLLGV